MRHRRVLVLLCALAVVLVPGVARSAGTVSGTVVQLEGGSPIRDAIVTVAGPGQSPVTTRTDEGGRFSIDVPGSGPYGVGIQAQGFASESVGRVAAGELAPFALRPAEYTPLPVYDGQGDVVADAASGIFYAIIGFAPDVYRTVDYGGSWQPVTMSYDDPDDGLRNSVQHKTITASGVPGEVAVASEGGAVFFSTDYGLTWRRVGGGIPPVPVPGGGVVTPLLFWGHGSPGAASVLLVAQPRGGGGWGVWRADMSVDAPAFNQDAADPFGTGSVIAFADSRTGSFAGRVSASGELSFAPLTASGPITFGSVEVSGLPTPPLRLRLGGAEEDAAPPDGALVVGGASPPTAQMLTKAAGAASFTSDSLSAPTALPAECQAGTSPGHSVAPTSGGSSGAGNSGFCWLRKEGTALSVFQTLPGGGLAYDVDWGRSNHVAFTSGAAGIVKSAQLDANGAPIVPAPDREQPARPGPSGDSGGVAVTGITSPDVRDTVYGPAGSSDLAVAVTDLSLASRDGGQSVTAVGGASNAVQWWRGASGEWLVFGHAACGGLTAFLNWNVTTPRATSPNVSGSTCADLGVPPADPSFPGTGVLSLQPVPETDTLFMGVGGGGGGSPHIYRARLVAGDPPAVSLTDVVRLDPAEAPLYSPHAMAYCPDGPRTRPAMRDVLFVATGGVGPGSLLRITGASGPSPVVAVVPSIPHDSPNSSLQDVRADCATGLVYAGGNSPNIGALYRSDDGGQTFALITGPGTGLPAPAFISAIGLNPADGKDVKVAMIGGIVVQSADAGTTWTIVTDPAVDRPIAVHDIEFTPAPAAPAGAQAAAVAPGSLGLVGTGSGVFHGAITATSGVLAVGGTGGGRGLAAQISDLRSDARPTLALPGPGGQATSVFHRSNGLYQAISTIAGSWSLPTLIPGTSGADDFPATAPGAAGRLHLAFARTGAAPGIYVATRETTGTWSTPKRVSSRRGDTLPAITASGTRIDVAFLRTRGYNRGIYHVGGRRGRFGRGARIRGTGAADAKPALGGPALVARGRNLHVAFARGRGGRPSRPGIHYASRRGSRWSAPRRLTRAAGDQQPALVVGRGGVNQIVFRRGRGRRRGLFALRGERRWSLARIAGTNPADREPALTVSRSEVLLAFARPAGTRPGVYYARAGRRGRWLAKPVRWSGSAADRHPSVGADRGGRLTIVFERG